MLQGVDIFQALKAEGVLSNAWIPKSLVCAPVATTNASSSVCGWMLMNAAFVEREIRHAILNPMDAVMAEEFVVARQPPSSAVLH